MATAGTNLRCRSTPPRKRSPRLRVFRRCRALANSESAPSFWSARIYAGHILGASSLELVITENGKSMTVLFSGDVGRYDQPILNDPEKPPAADVVLCESTYGDREHPAVPPPDQALADVVNRVAKRGGVIVVPAFAVDRTQLLLYYLRQLEARTAFRVCPIYMDSPMAIDVTSIYMRHRKDPEIKLTAADADGNPFDGHNLHIMRSVDESKQINDVHTPAIIVSASGMATGGRVMHHLAQRLPDPRNCVLLAGYQGEGTGGRLLEDGAKFITIHGHTIPVRAEVANLHQFSAHAGRSELLRWLSGLPAPPRKLFLTHGEPEASVALQSGVKSQLGWSATLPKYLESFELGS